MKDFLGLLAIFLLALLVAGSCIAGAVVLP